MEEETLESKSMDIDMHINTITATATATATATEEAVDGSEVAGGQAISDAQNPSSTSSDSDSDEEDDEAQQHLQIQALETELSNNPSDYESHVQYIRLLRKMGLIDKLREAREAMNALFPLTPQMWQEWAKDEISLDNSSEAFSVIEKLYERGVLDYLSISLWCEYINFVQECDPSVRECSAAGILKARNLFERALTAAGLHVAEGSKIWEAYREFELAIFHTIDETNVEEKEKQVQRIRSIFHRELSVPLCNLRSTLLAYKTWEVEKGNMIDAKSSDLDGISAHVASAYQKALDMYNSRAHFEEQISRQDILDQERLQQFMVINPLDKLQPVARECIALLDIYALVVKLNAPFSSYITRSLLLNYLRFEQSSGDPARVQVLYERAITEFPITSDLWLDYTRYLDKTLKGASVVREVYSRATRNCPWVGGLWVRYLLSLERGLASEKDISTVFEKSLQCTFTSFDEYLDLFLTRIDGLRRRLSLAREAEDVLNFALIRDTFQHASDYLSPNLKNTVALLRLHTYWARLELNLRKDIAAARAVWESLLKISGSMLEVWQGYIAMEVESGHINEARSIYRRCYSKRFPEMGSEDICNSWLRFEREFGSLEEFDHAVQKITPRLEELQFYRFQQESKGVVGSTDQTQNSNKKREKRKPDSIVTSEQPLAKRQKDAAQNLKGEYGKDKAQAQKSVQSSKVDEVKAKVDIPESKKEQGIKDFRPRKTKPYTDQCTAFISNLNVLTNEENLRDFFKDGGVVAIRILKDKYSGKSRGLAYVDFSDEAHLAAALAKNRQTLLGKRLSIAKSDPKQRKTGQSIPPGHGNHASNQGDAIGSESNESGAPEARPATDDKVQLKGRNTFAVPRNVKPLGWTNNKGKADEREEETPKSNDEFRKMFLSR